MSIASKSLILAATFVLGACSHYNEDLTSLDGAMMKSTTVALVASPQDIAPAAGGKSAPSPSLGNYLAREYYDLAKYENDKAYDYKAAKMYTGKAMAASQGKITAPSRVAAFDVPPAKISELNGARQSLIAALTSGNTQGNEMVLAKAQTSFDCWLERSEESSNDTHSASCRESFEQSMAQLVMPSAGVSSAQMMEVAFAPGASAVDAAATPSIDQVAQFLATPQGAGYTAVITGFTQFGTPTEADRQLATSRVLKVREILLSKGVADAFIKPQIAPVPQTANIVPVAGSVAADQGGLDRKVQIHLVAPAKPGVANTTTQTYAN